MKPAQDCRPSNTRSPCASAHRKARSPTPICWAVELQLADRDTSDVQEKLDALERSRGRAPGTTYLRARLSFILGDESPRAIAERASSLALSMSAFPELELLAAEAWTRAGERRRALAYVRDLTENPQVDAQLRARARALVEGASAPSGERPALARPPTPSVAAEMLAAADAHSPEPEPPDTTRASEPAIVAITTGTRASYLPPKMPSAPPPSASRAAAAPAPAAASPTATAAASAPPPDAPSPQTPVQVRPPEPTPAAMPLPEPPPPPPPAPPPPPVVAAPPRPEPPKPEVDVATREASIRPLPIVDVGGSFTPMSASGPVTPEAPSLDDGRAPEGAIRPVVVAPEPQGAPSRTSTWAPPHPASRLHRRWFPPGRRPCGRISTHGGRVREGGLPAAVSNGATAGALSGDAPRPSPRRGARGARGGAVAPSRAPRREGRDAADQRYGSAHLFPPNARASWGASIERASASSYRPTLPASK